MDYFIDTIKRVYIGNNGDEFIDIRDDPDGSNSVVLTYHYGKEKTEYLYIDKEKCLELVIKCLQSFLEET